MKPISYRRHRFPPDVIRHAVWPYLRFTLSFRDVEDLLAERGLIVSNESVRRWVVKFGPSIVKNLRAARSRPHHRWRLDEIVVSIGGRCDAPSTAKARPLTSWSSLDGTGLRL
jgi:putative transposase